MQAPKTAPQGAHLQVSRICLDLEHAGEANDLSTAARLLEDLAE